MIGFCFRCSVEHLALKATGGYRFVLAKKVGGATYFDLSNIVPCQLSTSTLGLYLDRHVSNRRIIEQSSIFGHRRNNCRAKFKIVGG